jgi:hypothetical protein
MIPSLGKAGAMVLGIFLAPFWISRGSESPVPFPTGSHLQRVRKFYTTADGLPSDEIQAVAVTRDGLVLAAASNSVARLEGERWSVAAGPTGVTTVFAPAEGAVALAGGSNGVWSLAAGNWKLEDHSPERVMCFATEP